jgi:hypothetical protein
MAGVGPKVGRYLHWVEHTTDAGRSLWYSNPDYARVAKRIAVRWGDTLTGCMVVNTGNTSDDLRTTFNTLSRGHGGRVRRTNSPLSGENSLDPYFSAWFGAE